MSWREGCLLGGEAWVFVLIRTDGRSLLAFSCRRICVLAVPALSWFVLAVAPSVELLDENVAVVLVQLVGQNCLIVIQVRLATALQMLLIQVEVHALVVDLLLQDLVILVLHELRQRLLVLRLRNVVSRGHRKLKVIVEIAESIDDCAQLFVLLLEHLDLIRELVYLVNELLGVLHLPLLLVQEQLEHNLIVLVWLLIVAAVYCSGSLCLHEFGVLD